MEMRRSDRRIDDPSRIAEIVEGCDCLRIGFNDNGEVYIVPLNYGYESSGDSYRFYFHGAKEGRKVDLIASSPILFHII